MDGDSNRRGFLRTASLAVFALITGCCKDKAKPPVAEIDPVDDRSLFVSDTELAKKLYELWTKKNPDGTQQYKGIVVKLQLEPGMNPSVGDPWTFDPPGQGGNDGGEGGKVNSLCSC